MVTRAAVVLSAKRRMVHFRNCFIFLNLFMIEKTESEEGMVPEEESCSACSRLRRFQIMNMLC